jgi:alpha-tubulin suppressor-like RCC1 family protein
MISLRHTPLLLAFMFGSAASDAGAQRPRTTLENFKVFIDFTANSGYLGHPDKQDEARRGLAMGFKMWQSVIPDLQIRWVNSAADANFTISFGSYTTADAIKNTACSNFVGWSGCGDATHVWVNDAGSMPFDYDIHTFIDRKTVYDSYVPATYPPKDYVSQDNPGVTTGYYNLGPASADDFAFMAFHEFGHSLGMSHKVASLQEWHDWYGKPHNPADGFAPEQPYVTPDRYLYPGLPVRPQVYGFDPRAYFGGGTADQPWISGLNQLHPMVNSHFVGAGTPSDGDGSILWYPPEGMTWPPIAKYNSRIVFAADVDPHYIPKYDWSYPGIAGLIRMQTAPVAGVTPKIYLTSDWNDAFLKSKLNQTSQAGGYFVTDLFPRIMAKPKVAAGFTHTLAIRHDGTLWAWGKNDKGQLGRNNTTSYPKPVQVGTDKTWAAVAAGDYVSFGLKKDGTLWSWGANDDGLLGNGATSATPRLVPDQVCKVSGPACYGNRYVSMSAGAKHVLALKNDGTVWAWGRNPDGELGDGTRTNRFYPTQIYGGDHRWISISAGGFHSVALNKDGEIWTWGSNVYGELGQGDFSSSAYPALESSAGHDWAQIAAGRYHTIALKKNGSVWGWGDNSSSQLGNGSTTLKFASPAPAQGEGLADDWACIGAGTYASGGIRMNGKIYTWGANDNGVLGNGAIATRTLPGTIYKNQTDWSSFAMGYMQCFALKTNGFLWGWGNNTDGEVGVNSTGNTKNTPQQTYFSLDKPAIAIAIGSPVVASPGTFDIVATASLNVYKVEYDTNGVKFATVTTAPFGLNWTGVPKGIYSLTAKAYDRMGTSVTSSAIIVSVFDLSEWSSATAPSTINLTTAGTVDWAHWGLGAATDFNHKSGVAQQIVFLQEIDGEDLIQSPSGSTTVTWSDGTPTGTATTKRGLSSTAVGFSTTVGFGYEIEAKSSATARTLKIYLNVHGVDLDIHADVNGTGRSTQWTGVDGNRVYSITLAAGDPAGTGIIATVKVGNIRATGGSFTLLGAAIQ